MISKFTDDTKIGRKVSCEEHMRDMDRLKNRARIWKKEYKVGKCECLFWKAINKISLLSK